jgi:hypothetical protein
MTGGHLAVGTAGALAFANDVRIGSDGRSIAIGPQGGTGAATTGYVRLANGGAGGGAGAVMARGASADINLVSLLSDDVVRVGDTAAAELDLNSSSILDVNFSGDGPAYRFGSSALDLRNKNLSLPTGGYIHMAGGQSGPGAQTTYVCDPNSFAARLAALPSTGGTLELLPGNYGTQTITQTGGNITIAFMNGGVAPNSSGPRANIAISWVTSGTPVLNLVGLNLIGSPNAMAQFTAAAATLTLTNCVVRGTIDARLGAMLTLDNTDAESVWGSALELRNGSKVRGGMMNGTATRAELAQFQSPAGTVHTSVGTLAMDPGTLDTFLSSRSKLGGSGPIKTTAGMAFGGLLGDVDATIYPATGPIWAVAGTNTGNRIYYLVATGAGDSTTVIVENRDSSAFTKSIYAPTGTPSGTIATLSANMGHVFKHTPLAGYALQSRYGLS